MIGYVFVFLLFGNHSGFSPIEIGGFKTELECNTERVEILKDMPKYYAVSRCYKVWK